jgi:hypothetical protein
MGEIVCWMLQDRRLAIAVVSRDVKLANAVIEEAERRGVKAIHVIDPAQIPLSVKAAVVKLGEGIGAGHAAPVPVEDFNSAVAAVDRAMEISLGRGFRREGGCRNRPRQKGWSRLYRRQHPTTYRVLHRFHRISRGGKHFFSKTIQGLGIWF